MAANKCCKSCVWARWELTPAGRITKNISGHCVYPYVPAPAPAALEVQLSKRGIWADYGKECETYENNEGAKLLQYTWEEEKQLLHDARKEQ